MESGVFERIRGLLADQLGIEPENITPNSDLINELGADSLDAVELIMALEEEFDIELQDEDANNFRTVGDLAAYVEANS